MEYAPLKDKCRSAVIRKAWRDVPESKTKALMLQFAERLWSKQVA
ncbi:hypothetical protein [Pantoea stewartii]|nr:hypothetical protein [Pantoea stewartii]